MDVSIPVVVDRALRQAGIPIAGVSIGSLTDRTTWTAQYLPSATDAQKAQGAQILATLDPQDAPTVTAVKSDVSTVRVSDELLRAIVQGLHEAIPAPALTLAQLRARILAIYRGLL